MKFTEDAGRSQEGKSWFDKLKTGLKTRMVRYLTIGVSLSLVGTMGYYGLAKPNAYAVLIDGEEVAWVTEQQDADQILTEIQTVKALYGPVRPIQDIAYEPVRVKANEITEATALRNTLEENLNFVSDATAILIDGKEIGIVPDFATAERIIATVKGKYLPDKKDGLRVETAAFDEEITFEPKETSIEAFSDPQVLEELLLHGTEKMETYYVAEGDSLWSIARKNAMTVEELKEANPQLKSELLSIGQELKLVKAEPFLHLVTTYKLSTEENIPYETKYESDAKLYRGQERVKKPGVAGLKAIQYRIVERNGNQVSKDVMTENILKKPEDRVVVRGTKTMIASRGDGGSGQLAWPIRGTISSPYGKRGREFHTGLDVSAPRGTPIGAAEAGKVIFAGRSGGYGLMVTVDHGDGLTTRYAHCSEIKAKVGDQVTRGQVIALVGATGRATGSHLHFEVRVNGNHRNPIGYLR